MASEDRDGHDEPEAGDDDVGDALDRERQDPVRARHERIDGRPVEVLDLARGERVVEHVDRDADDLARLLGDVGDAIDELPLAERQADRDLVDDPLVEDLLGVRERARARASASPPRSSGRRR